MCFGINRRREFLFVFGDFNEIVGNKKKIGERVWLEVLFYDFRRWWVFVILLIFRLLVIIFRELDKEEIILFDIV